MYRVNADKASTLLASPDLQILKDPALIARKTMLEGYVRLVRMDAKADEVLQQAVQQSRAAKDGESESTALMLRARASLTAGDEAAAEKYYRDSFIAAKQTGDAYLQAASLLNLGFFELKAHNVDSAIPVLQRAQILAQQADAELLRTSALSNIALCQARLGDYDAAIRTREEVLEVLRRAGLPRPLMNAVGELGNVHLDLGHYEKASAYFAEAAQMAKKIKTKEDVASWLAARARAQIEEGRLKEAEKSNAEARSNLTRLEGATYESVMLNDGALAEKRRDPASAQKLYEQLLKVTAKRPNARWKAYIGLARLSGARGDRPMARQQYEQALQIIEKMRAELLRTDYKLSFLTALIGAYRDYVDALVSWGDDVGALEVVESSRAQLLATRTGANLRSASLQSESDWRRLSGQMGATLLSFWTTPKRSYIWVINQNTFKRVTLPGADELKPLAERYRSEVERELRNPLTGGSGAAQELFEKILAPVAVHIPKNGRVLFAPDGFLHNLNAEMLVSSAPKPHYWLDDVILSIVPSLTILEGQTPPSGSGSALLIGDALPQGADFPKLTFAASELTGIASKLKRATVREGAAATPRAFLDAPIGGYSMIHFAAHAIANRESPLDSAIILSPAASGYKLYSREVAGVHMNADLVTISACQSAGTRAYLGEGLVGFAWAFLHAGARNVIAGLWNVSDRSTSELMTKLYEEISAGKAPDEALRSAKLTLRQHGQNYQKPYYWAPFQLYTQSPAGSAHPARITSKPFALRAAYAPKKTNSH